MSDWSKDIRPLVRKIGKPPEEWVRADLIEYCLRERVRVINFRYPSLDGKLRELRLPVNSPQFLERVLAAGERVDGSNLFPGVFDAADSDLYVVPVYRWAFVNPFREDELDIVCRYADRDGNPCDQTPDNVLEDAASSFQHRTGLELEALTELEFYLFVDAETQRFTGKSQRNYQQAGPYIQSREVADEILRITAEVTGRVKYCHSEVGYMDRIESDEREIDGCRVEQYELEFDLMPIEDLGCWTTVARWLIRVVANRQNASVTFLPKLDEGMAGNGMHVHLALKRDGHNVMQTAPGELSDDALGLIGGLLGKAAPMTGLGSTVAASFLRLVPGQEAPTSICWGRHNRAGLVRVPLGFATSNRLDHSMNPAEPGEYPSGLERPTVEFRSPDGSAYPHLLLAAVAMCVDDGVGSGGAVEHARALELSPGQAADHSFEQLPASAVSAADSLERSREFFEARGMPPRLIDIVLAKLRDETDDGLTERLRRLPAAERLMASRRLMHKDIHKH